MKKRNFRLGGFGRSFFGGGGGGADLPAEVGVGGEAGGGVGVLAKARRKEAWMAARSGDGRRAWRGRMKREEVRPAGKGRRRAIDFVEMV